MTPDTTSGEAPGPARAGGAHDLQPVLAAVPGRPLPALQALPRRGALHLQPADGFLRALPLRGRLERHARLGDDELVARAVAREPRAAQRLLSLDHRHGPARAHEAA